MSELPEIEKGAAATATPNSILDDVHQSKVQPSPRQVAEWWQGAGFKVFPIEPETKEPRFKGYQAGTDDVAAHWALYPKDRVGLLCECIVVLDVDTKDGRDGRQWLAVNRARLPVTYEVTTPSGGTHLYFAIPEGAAIPNDTAGKSLGPGIDVKANGRDGASPGYVLAAGQPGYVGNSAKIAHLPDWLRGALCRAPEVTGALGAAHITPLERLEPELERYCRAIRELVPGEQQSGFTAAAYAVGALVRDGLDESTARTSLVVAGLMMPNEPDKPKWSERDIMAMAERKLAEGKRRPVATADLTAMGVAPNVSHLPGLHMDPAFERVPVEYHIGQDHELLAAINDGLNKRGVPIFECGGRLCIVGTSGLHFLDEAALQILLAENFTCSKFRSKSDGTIERVSCAVPASIRAPVLSGLNAAGGDFRSLRGTVDSPFVHRDGTVANKIGYDSATRLYQTARMALPAIPDKPTRDDALAALAIINRELLSEVAFASDQDRSAALALMLSAITRPAIDFQPGFFVSAPQVGTGKSYLAEILSWLATGAAAVSMVCPPKDDELEKTIHGALIDRRRTIAIDNVNREFRSTAVSQALTQPTMLVRELGTSKTHEIDTGLMTFVANGNNMSITHDLERRMIGIRLDADVENAFQRTFSEVTPVDRIKADRPRYIAALMTIIRARIHSGYKAPGRLNGFDEWNDLVRGACLWLGMPDPWRLLTRQSPEQDEHAERLSVLADFKPSEYWRPKDLLIPPPGFKGAFGEFYERDDILNIKRISMWLARHVDRRVEGMKLVATEVAGERFRRVPAYRVIRVTPEPVPNVPEP